MTARPMTLLALPGMLNDARLWAAIRPMLVVGPLAQAMRRWLTAPPGSERAE